MSAVGFMRFVPAYVGDDPCVASNTAASVPMFAPPAMPSPPIIAAQRSETMSP